MRNALPALLLLGMSAAAEQEIYRCPQEDGTVAFRETPCPLPAVDSDVDDEGKDSGAPPADHFADFVNPYDEAEDQPAAAEPAPLAPVSKDRAECEQTTRDAIDQIDLELRKGDTNGARQQYLAELLELTKQLRACKQL